MPKKLLPTLILLLAVGGSIFYIWKQQAVVAPTIPEPVVQPEPTLSPDEPIDTSDWKTYRNEEYGFELKYPEKYFYLREDVDGADIVYITVLKNGRAGIDTDKPGKIGILLNNLFTEKYSFAKKQGLCSNSVFNSYVVEICSKNKVDFDVSKSSYESFVKTGLCDEGFGFSAPLKNHDFDNPNERKHDVYITCDGDDLEGMEWLFGVFKSIQFVN